jgi:hypothetical protein
MFLGKEVQIFPKTALSIQPKKEARRLFIGQISLTDGTSYIRHTVLSNIRSIPAM